MPPPPPPCFAPRLLAYLALTLPAACVVARPALRTLQEDGEFIGLKLNKTLSFGSLAKIFLVGGVQELLTPGSQVFQRQSSSPIYRGGS